MVKLIKIFTRIFLLSFEWAFLLIILFLFGIRTSFIQTRITKIATNYLSSELKTTIKLDGIHIINLNEIAVDGLLIKDLNKDTLISINTLYLSINKIIPTVTDIDEIEIDKGIFYIKRFNHTDNFQFLVDYFSSNEKKKKTKSSPVYIHKITMNDSKFFYDNDDYYYSIFGIDYDHIHTKNINLEIKRFKIKDDQFNFYIKQLSCSEKSGIKLNKFSAQVKVSENGIHTRRLAIETENSSINAPTLELITNQYEDFFYPNDSIYFNAKVLSSKVDLKELSYFAPELEGMVDVINVKGNVAKTVNNLKIKDFDIRFGEKSSIKGTANLPNFKEIKKSFIDEKIDYCYIDIKDLEQIKLPYIANQNYINASKYFDRLNYLEGNALKITGFIDQFVIAGNKINTALGSVEMGNGILFTENEEGYNFTKSSASEYDIKINEFNIGKLVDNNSIGNLDGIFFMSGYAKSFEDITFTNIDGDINKFEFENYPYANITIKNGKLIDNVFSSKIEVKDENLALTYDGYIDFNNGNHLKMSIDLSEAILNNLNLSSKKSSLISSKFNLDIRGSNFNTFEGQIELDGLVYKENEKQYQLNDLTVFINRTKESDHLYVNSALGDVAINGKINFNTFLKDFKNQFHTILPNLFDNNKINDNNKFEYTVTFKEVNKLFKVILPELKISNGTQLSGKFDGPNAKSEIKIKSNSISYNNYIANNIDFENTISLGQISTNLNIQNLIVNDSLSIRDLKYDVSNEGQILTSQLNWNHDSEMTSSINWETTIQDFENFHVKFLPSHININEKKWLLEQNGQVDISNNIYKIAEVKLKHEHQFLYLNGVLSDNPSDFLQFKVNSFDINDIGKLFGLNYNLKGKLNGWGNISTPFTNLKFNGDVFAEDFFIDNREIGSLFIKSNYNSTNQLFNLEGDLIYRNNKTFHFDGNYNHFSPVHQLDFDLSFDHTDLKFVNAFLDSNIVSNIEGEIVGKIKLNGMIDAPDFNGRANLENGNARLSVMNVHYALEGEIFCDKYGFYINKMPITDEEGNKGNVIGSAYHTNFSNWNFDILFNLEDDLYRTKNNVLAIKPLERFLVMNTNYSDDNVYYGKGYGTGIINIFGDLKTIDIDVNLTTKAGSKIYFPFYTVSEMNEEEDFIHFISKSTVDESIKPKFNLSGVNLNMNFTVTPDAELKLILDENTGDEITAKGEGDLNLALDQLDNFTLNGAFKVKNGKYNFVMRPINEQFIIEENGSVTWTGDPYNAFIDLKCYYPVNASLNEISRNIPTTNMGNQEVLCYLNLKESLLKPTISFDIVAPKSDETGKTLLNLVKSNQDMLNQQFFSLLLFKKFQSIDVQTNNSSGTGSAALDIAQGQINSMLSQVSKDYKLNVALDKNALTGSNSMAVGVTKGFYNDRLVFKGSVGVNSTGTNTTTSTTTNYNQNPLIGDVNIEYLLNESGTFKVNIFNESNQNTLLNNQLGLFTQGAGLQYQEDFTSIEEFKVLQYFLDVFRKKGKKKFPEKRKRKQELIVIPPKENE